MTDTPVKLGLIGWPVTHSLSPQIHESWLQQQELTGSYGLVPVEDPAHLAGKLQELTQAGYRGVNVTIPHKEAVVPLMDELNPAAKAIGAVNTMLFEEGQITGHNTDAFGLIENLKQQVEEWSPTEKAVMVLGAGGAARAAVYAFQQEGARILITNRTLEKADALCQEFGAKSVAWEEKESALEFVDLLVNTTSLGMTGQPALEIDLGPLPSTAIVYDIVYNPLETRLLEQAKARNLKAVTGLGMLIFQAQKAFEIWTGCVPAVDLESLGQSLRKLC